MFVDGYDSDTLLTKNGMPQGSVLGPLLFNLFINDICNIKLAKKVLFADDTVLYVTDLTLSGCIEKTKHVINELTQWLFENKLLANKEKTKLMLISPRVVTHLPNIEFNGSTLQWVNSIDYLGITLDHKLNFNIQVDEVCKRLNSHLGVIYSLSPFVPRTTLVNIYNTLVYPTLINNIIIWGCMNKSNENRIQVILNKILRVILKVRYNDNHVPLTSVNSMFKELGLLKFRDVYEYFILKFIHFVSYKRFDVFLENFARLLPTSRYYMRDIKINLPAVRTDAGKNFTVFQSCLLMQNLPMELFIPQSSGTLRNKYFELALSKY